MKCNNCGFEYQDNLNTCPNCDGADVFKNISLNPAADIVSAAITDSLFFVMCILMSASSLCALLADGMPVLNILFTIFMWLAYAQARKGILGGTHLRSLSGTTFAVYVINYVLAGAVALIGLAFASVAKTIFNTPDMLNEFESLLELEDPMISEFAINLIKNYSGLIAVIFIVIATVVIVLNIFSMGKIHKFAKSVYKSVDMNTIGFQSVTVAKVWLYILGCFGIVSAILNIDGFESSNILPAVADVCYSLTAIFAGVLTGKYFKN